MLTVSAEDCFGIITKEIVALNQADSTVNSKDYVEGSNLTFIARAIMLLCAARKSRDADYVALNYLLCNPKLNDDELLAFSVHTENESLAMTDNGYTAEDMMTMLHSSVCQSDIPHASYAALELYSLLRKQMWDRLLAASDED